MKVVSEFEHDIYTLIIYNCEDRNYLGRPEVMLKEDEKISVLSEDERTKLAEKAVEAIIGNGSRNSKGRKKKGPLRRTRRN